MVEIGVMNICQETSRMSVTTGGYARAMEDSPSNGPEKPAKHLDF